MKILFQYNEWGVNKWREENNAYGGIGYYRIIKPALELKKKGYDVEIRGKDLLEVYGKSHLELCKNVFEKFDMVWTKGMDDPHTASAFCAAANYYHKPLVLDLDDNFLAVREDNPAHTNYAIGTSARLTHSAFTACATQVVTSTEPLKNALAHLNDKIAVLPNCNDVSDWNYKKYVFGDGKLRIGYMGSTTHNPDLELLVEPMNRILEKYPHVEFQILGAKNKDAIPAFAKKFKDISRVRFFAGTPGWLGYPELVATFGWDIGLAPLIKDDFNISKSHIKWMEYAMYRTPCVASDVYPYSEPIQDTPVIEHKKTGLLSRTAEDWFLNISRLIEDRKFRTEIGENAYEHVKNKWQYSQHIHKWEKIINDHI